MRAENFVVISEAELKIKEWEVFLNIDDMEDLLDSKEIFKKFITKSIHAIQAQLATGALRWKEAQAYNFIDWYKQLIEWLDNTWKAYNKHMEAEKKRAEKR